MVKYDTIDIAQIVPSGYNPRMMNQIEYEKLQESIEHYGFVDPIIINLQNQHIIGGHQRYDVILDKYLNDEISGELKLIKLGNIGWVFTDTELKVNSDADEKGLNLALNKISGEWDDEKLVELFSDLEDSGFDTNLTGFDNEEITNFEMDLISEGIIANDDGGYDFDTVPQDQYFIADRNSTLKYILHFKTGEDKRLWYEFVTKANEKYPDEETVGERIVKAFSELLVEGKL